MFSDHFCHVWIHFGVCENIYIAKVAMACVGVAVSTFVVTRKSYPDIEESKDENAQEANHNLDVNTDQRMGGG